MKTVMSYEEALAQVDAEILTEDTKKANLLGMTLEEYRESRREFRIRITESRIAQLEKELKEQKEYLEWLLKESEK